MPNRNTSLSTPSTMESNSKHTEHNTSDESSKNKDTLLPGLPNHFAELCLSFVHPSILYKVNRSWRRLIYSPSFPPFFSLYALLCPSPCQTARNHMYDNNNNSIKFLSLDPISSTWTPLPSPPPDPPLHLLHHHPSFLSRKLPIQTVTVSGNLVVIAATNHQFMPALSCPLVFNPTHNKWFYGPPVSVPRRWCATGSVAGSVYVASGVGSNYNGDVARSMERWDLNLKWEKKVGLKDGKFSREAVEAVGYRGKLCMVNVKGNTVKEGAIYDVESDKWEDMPIGMIAGWNGPAATMDEMVMYVVDEAKGRLSKYDAKKDCWEKLIESVELKGAEQMDAGRGRVCVVCAKGERVVVVDVVVRPVRIWVVEPPRDLQVVTVHILPRMSTYD
ncbi:F-box/kelch-repeat protein SKIP25-like [Fagus crenata]